MSHRWYQVESVNSKKYTCGYCGNGLASDKGYRADWAGNGAYNAAIHICHFCTKPTYFAPDGNQTPGVVFGNSVADIDDKSVEDLYEEARKCTGAGAYTSAVLASRKLLMHIAVSKGADAGKKFIEYVEYLSEKNFIPPDAKSWVDHIREKGNEANHEIVIMNDEAAKDLLAFIEMLLRIIYEFPANVKRKHPSASPSS